MMASTVKNGIDRLRKGNQRHRACLHATMLTITVIKLTFGEITRDYFPMRACYITQSSTFYDCIFIYVPEKMSSNTLHYFILYVKGNIIWTCSVAPVMSLSVAFISFAKKSSHTDISANFFFSVFEDIVLFEFMK